MLASKTTELVKEFHSKTSGGDKSSYTMVGNIIQAEYYWPTIFQEAFIRAHNCEKYQKFVVKKRNAMLPLEPILVEEPIQ